MRTLIKGGRIIDGTGRAERQRDVLIRDGSIEAVEPNISARADEIVEASGKIVCPGFVDMHRHCDVAPMRDGDFGMAELSQGITFAAVGNCGIACAPIPEKMQDSYRSFSLPVLGDTDGCLYPTFEAYFSALSATPKPIHMGVMAATGAVKVAVKGFSPSPYTPGELQSAQALVASAMDQGALGVTLGFMYQPECYTTEREQAAVIAPAARAGRILTTHIRGEGDSLVKSVDEVIRVADTAGVPLQISHFKCTGIRNWGRGIYEAMEHIEAARARGQKVTVDFYPYSGGSTTIFSLIPPDILRDTNEETLHYLSTKEGREAFRLSVSRAHPDWDNMALSIGWDRILIASTHHQEDRWMSGQDMESLSRRLGYAHPALFAAELMARENGLVGIIVMSMDDHDVDAVARLPYSVLISDALYGGGDNPHPRLYGAFPHFIRDFALNRRILPLETAVMKMTMLPARALGLGKKGILAPGMDADVCIINESTLTDKADYARSRVLSQGVERVLVAGKTAWKDGQMTGDMAGRVCLADGKEI